MSRSGDEQPDLAASRLERARRLPSGRRWAHDFAPASPGNPSGRREGARNLSTIVAAALSERVTVNENGRRRSITKLEAAVKQLVNRAATGEARATQLLLALIQANEARPVQQDAGRLGDADAIVMAELLRRLREGGS